MGIVFSVCIDQQFNVTKVSAANVSKTQKICNQVVGKIKKCFVSLVDSVSNSFCALTKIFSFSNVKKNMASDKKESQYVKTIPTLITESKKPTVLSKAYLRSSRQIEFDMLKSDIHTKLKACFANKINV